MFDFIYRRKRVVQAILALIMLPFAFWGVDSYLRGGESVPELARVGSAKITANEFGQALRDQQDRMRKQLGQNYDPTVFANPEVRYALLEQLISQRLLQEQARRDHFRVSDMQLAQFIGELPPFQEDGRFSRQRYESLLADQNMTPLGFEQTVRQDLLLLPLQEPVAGANIVAQSNVLRYLALLDQQREVAISTIDADAYVKDVKIDEAAVKAYYDANPLAFQIPEQVKVEYVTLTPEKLSGQVSVSAAEVQKQYDDNPRQFAQAEQRQASHILIAVKADASDADKAAAKKKADEIAALARKNPAQFAELAKKNSQDPGSAGQGGDLGFFAQDGSMVKPFEEAVFAAKQGDIVGPVQTDFGWHIIRLTAIKPAKVRGFDEVKTQIEQDLRQQMATRKFAEAADQFQNLVYEQAESLNPVAKALGLQLETSPMVTRAQLQTLAQNSTKLVQVVFNPDSLQAKRNTEAIEVAPNTLMAARVVEYKAAAPRPFDEVKAEIKRQLEHKAASEMADKAGQEKLELLKQGKDAGLKFGTPIVTARNQPQPALPPEARTKIFQASSAALPAYVGVSDPRGAYSIYKVMRVIAPPAPDATRLAGFTSRVSDQLGRELFNAYMASLKSRGDVKVNQANLDKQTGEREDAPAPLPAGKSRPSR